MVGAAADGFGRLATAQIKAKPAVGGITALPGVQCELWEGSLALKEYFFTSESVSEGHPDKVADQISDAILDAILAQDKHSRVAAETLCNTGLVVLAGEITSNAVVDYQSVARETIKRIGYDNTDYGIDYKGCAVLVAYDKQSPDIAQGVDEGRGLNLDQGAGDQGLMFGYACDETPELMPLPIFLAHRLVQRQAQLRKQGKLAWLRPDAKSQVTVKYVDGRPKEIDTVVLSTQHHPDIEHGKLTVDTYGGAAPHGGGAFSGKDPSKVDRSAAYAARYVAKNIVASGLATKAQVQVSYAIGVAKPTSIMVTTFGTGKISDEKLEELVAKHFDLRPKGIIQMLDLLRPIYAKTAAYGHFGRAEPEFSWEKTDKADALAADAGVKRAANG